MLDLIIRSAHLAGKKETVDIAVQEGRIAAITPHLIEKATKEYDAKGYLVTAPFVSVASRVSHMLRGLLKGRLQKMGELFSREESRSTNVATFLALLELIRAGRVQVDDSGALQLDRTHRRRRDKTQ